MKSGLERAITVAASKEPARRRGGEAAPTSPAATAARGQRRRLAPGAGRATIRAARAANSRPQGGHPARPAQGIAGEQAFDDLGVDVDAGDLLAQQGEHLVDKGRLGQTEMTETANETSWSEAASETLAESPRSGRAAECRTTGRRPGRQAVVADPPSQAPEAGLGFRAAAQGGRGPFPAGRAPERRRCGPKPGQAARDCTRSASPPAPVGGVLMRPTPGCCLFQRRRAARAAAP